MICLVAFVLTSTAIWWFFVRNGISEVQMPVTEQNEEEEINYDPPTETDKTETRKTKDDLATAPETPTDSNVEGKKKVNVVVTNAYVDAGTVYVRGYVSGVVQTATCTYTFTGNGTVVKKNSSTPDASTTNCGLSMPSSQLKGDGWSVVVSYSSSTLSGTSKKQSVEGL